MRRAFASVYRPRSSSPVFIKDTAQLELVWMLRLRLFANELSTVVEIFKGVEISRR